MMVPGGNGLSFAGGKKGLGVLGYVFEVSIQEFIEIIMSLKKSRCTS